MKKRIAINGFGRIGRATARLILTKYSDQLELVAINDPSPIETTAHLFQFDSNFGIFEKNVAIVRAGDETFFDVDGTKIHSFSTRNITDLPWGNLKIDIVLECTGVFRTAEKAQPHLDQGAKKVLLSAPAKDDKFRTIVLGVNDSELLKTDVLVSNASCTTNCLAPVAKVLHENFEIKSGLMTTIHAYTNDQKVLDVGHKDLRRARSAGLSMIPTSTGAAKAVGIVCPDLEGKLTGLAVRVPTPTVSLVDLVVKVGKKTTVEEVNAALKKASEKSPHILGFETRPLVSKDFQGDARSSIVDAAETLVIDDLVKVLAWYDNEWGYSCRFVELAAMM
ncbi:type I glyceraldehyde-3-phosphate dehydrogenase [bacterium]|jgi:glyceraldehyde 3-phosphate dehydrogenase|nr:type I glyceraldehyde-3-phosphate dehydrogenase [bacterium]MBT6832082.1 type I glyceraldehyde-3-phosphate dehydrogenase [bacterium]MBT6995863.1 type I glyceraldehyde-3-phosphate dehydrogenase [bacterium]MBT7772612.1 type I glyceraldehyde-3-phosphate dehydrogenase [bacterium]